MWFLFIYLQLSALQAQDRIFLHGSKSPCQGRLEVYRANQSGLVGYHNWKNTNGEVVCKSLGCGAHMQSGYAGYKYADLPQRSIIWMDGVECTGTENNLWDCSFSGWNASQCNIHNYVEVECSGSNELTLNHNGRIKECAGVVQFETANGAVSICNLDWDQEKANKVCEQLKCGKLHKIAPTGTFVGERSSYRVPINCIDNEISWQCVDWVTARKNTCSDEANIICSEYKHFRLRGNGSDVCQGILEMKKSSLKASWIPVLYRKGYRMADAVCSKLDCGNLVSVKPCNETNNTQIICSDRVTVELLRQQKPTKCYGDLHVKVNGSHRRVCSEKNAERLQRIAYVVCQELGCGKNFTTFQGSQVNPGFISHVDCNGDEKSLWECLHRKNNVQPCQTIEISCTDSFDVRLMHGLDKCSGHLEVQHLGTWWSVHNNDWSNKYSDLVCRHLNCGESQETVQGQFVKSKAPFLKGKLACSNSPTDFTQCTINKNNIKNPVQAVNIICKGLNSFSDSTDSSAQLNSSYNCFGKNHSTSNTTLPSVNCSDSVEVKLLKGEQCWGKVLVCTDGVCGGVCLDTWKYNHSAMLCKTLGCGEALRGQFNGTTIPGISVGSVHCPPNALSFNQCSFVKMNKISGNCQNPAYVSCAGSVKAELQDPRDKCAGQVTLFYLGKQYPLCTDNIDKSVQAAICRNRGCGDALSFNLVTSVKTLGLSHITCDNDNISKCDFNLTEVQNCSVGYLKCTGWSRLLLTNLHSACSGKVYIQNETGLNAISSDGWQEQESKKLCTYLNCGKFSSKTVHQPDKPLWNRSFNCTGNPNRVWDCEVDKRPVEKKHLSITCDGAPNLSLLKNCWGEVRVNKYERMCESSQKTEMRVLSELCYQLGCGMFINASSAPYKLKARYYSCTGEENMLSQCKSWTDECEKVVSVTCSSSIKFRFKDTCGGELQVYYGGAWEPVCGLTQDIDAEMICMENNCGHFVKYSSYSSRLNEGLIFKCKPGQKKAMYCIQQGSCEQKLAKIYCQKHVPHVKGNLSTSDLVLSLLVGLILLLVVVFLGIWKRKRLLTFFRLRFSPEDMDMDMEYSSSNRHNYSASEYEDVEHSMNLVKDNHSRSQDLVFEIQPEEEDEKLNADEGSARSEYDDVDEEKIADINVPNPLFPPKPIASLVMNEGTLEEQEEYDDITTTPTLTPKRRGSSIRSTLPTNPSSLLSIDQVEH